MTNEIKLSSVVFDVTMPVDMLQDYVANAVSEALAQRDADHLAELRAYELTVANLREQLAQQAPQVPMTDDEIIEYFDEVSPKLGFGLDDLRAFTSGAVCAQSHHGIKEKP